MTYLPPTESRCVAPAPKEGPPRAIDRVCVRCGREGHNSHACPWGLVRLVHECPEGLR